jgi:hypothetical protein
MKLLNTTNCFEISHESSLARIDLNISIFEYQQKYFIILMFYGMLPTIVTGPVSWVARMCGTYLEAGLLQRDVIQFFEKEAKHQKKPKFFFKPSASLPQPQKIIRLCKNFFDEMLKAGINFNTNKPAAVSSMDDEIRRILDYDYGTV